MPKFSFSRNITPSGFPEEFSLVYTLRARKSPKYPWHVIKIVDANGDAQFLITMNSRKRTLDFSSVDHEGDLQTVSFVNDRVSVIELRLSSLQNSSFRAMLNVLYF